MENFFIQRLKAFGAALVAGIGPIVIKAVESGFSFDIPASWEAWIVAFFAGLAVNYISNVPAMPK